MLNLDTHILLHALDGNLSAAEQRLLAGEAWGISAIVIWEIAKLHQLGRITVDPGDADFSRVLTRVYVWPLNVEICRMSTKLDFVSDPADELIAATSIVHRARLVTRDRKLRGSKLVPIAR